MLKLPRFKDGDILHSDSLNKAMDAIEGVYNSSEQIRKEFKTLESLLHKTIVLVTHDIFEAFELGDKVCLMDKGKAQQIGTPRELIQKPANSFVQEFLDANCYELGKFCNGS